MAQRDSNFIIYYDGRSGKYGVYILSLWQTNCLYIFAMGKAGRGVGVGAGDRWVKPMILT